MVDTTPPSPLLLLVPTRLEARRLLDAPLPDDDSATHFTISSQLHVGLVGFGLAASGVWTSRHITLVRPNAVVLAGIAGTLAPERAPIGCVVDVTAVTCHGIGAGHGDDHVLAEDLGFPQSPDGGSDVIALTGFDRSATTTTKSTTGVAVSVAAASDDHDAARRVRARHPDATIEDLETWSVALAARTHDVPLRVLRAVSNVAGVRDKSEWRIDDALDSLHRELGHVIARLGGQG